MPPRAESLASSRIALGSAATGPASGVGRPTPVMAAKLAREGGCDPAGAADGSEALPLSMMARMIRLLSSYGYAAAAAVPYAPVGRACDRWMRRPLDGGPALEIAVFPLAPRVIAPLPVEKP